MQNQSVLQPLTLKLLVHMTQTFGQWLREKINQRNLTNAEVARRAGVSSTYIGNLVRDYSQNTKSGKARPSVEVVDQIAKALNVSTYEARLAAGYAPDEPHPRARSAIEALQIIEKIIPGFEGLLLAEPMSDEIAERVLEDFRMIAELHHNRARKKEADE